MKPYTRTSPLFNLLSAIIALLLWGGWAYYINHSIISGFAQGTASFVITLVMVRSVTWWYHHLPVGYGRLLLPSMLTVGMTGTALACIHAYVGSAHIIKTIAPALTVAFLFCIYTTFKLRKGTL